MANESIVSALVKGLAAYLKANVPELQAVYDDFPSPNQTLKYPCASIFVGSPNFQALPPYVLSKDENPQDSEGEGDDPAPRPFKVRRVVGIYEFRLQLDLWCQTKFERHILYDKIFNGFNSQPVTMGVSLQLENYFDQWARYNITGMEYVGSEEASQRSEWRIRIDIVADVKAIQEGLDYLMETIENTVETPNEALTGSETDSGSTEDVL